MTLSDCITIESHGGSAYPLVIALSAHYQYAIYY